MAVVNTNRIFRRIFWREGGFEGEDREGTRFPKLHENERISKNFMLEQGGDLMRDRIFQKIWWGTEKFGGGSPTLHLPPVGKTLTRMQCNLLSWDVIMSNSHKSLLDLQRFDDDFFLLSGRKTLSSIHSWRTASSRLFTSYHCIQYWTATLLCHETVN